MLSVEATFLNVPFTNLVPLQVRWLISLPIQQAKKRLNGHFADAWCAPKTQVYNPRYCAYTSFARVASEKTLLARKTTRLEATAPIEQGGCCLPSASDKNIVGDVLEGRGDSRGKPHTAQESAAPGEAKTLYFLSLCPFHSIKRQTFHIPQLSH